METKNQTKNSGKNNEKKPGAKKQGAPVNIEQRSATDKVNPKAGKGLKNDGTNFTYEEDIRN
jgi:hypothetical protein